MAKALIESLQLDLPALAKIIQSKGRKGDTILAHINPREAAFLNSVAVVEQLTLRLVFLNLMMRWS